MSGIAVLRPGDVGAKSRVVCRTCETAQPTAKHCRRCGTKFAESISLAVSEYDVVLICEELPTHKELRRALVMAALKRAGGDISSVVEITGIAAETIRRIRKESEIDDDE